MPGHEREMRALRDLFALHHSPRTNCTLWDRWLPMATLWPALGEEGSESAQPLRDYYRNSLMERRIDPQGYMAMNQHRGLAHPTGWPFPTWQQSGGAGWHFSLAGDAYAVSLNTPSADLSGWELGGIDQAAMDPARGAVLTPAGESSTLTSPRVQFSTQVAPFIVIEWSHHGGRPVLQWTTPQSPEFSPARQMAIPDDPASAPPSINGLRLCAVPMYQHPLWQGQISQLRLQWTNPRDHEVVIHRIHTAIDSRHPITGPNFIRGCLDYFRWTGDLEFLRAQIGRMRRAMQFTISEFDVDRARHVRVSWVGHDGRAGFANRDDGSKVIHYGQGVGNNYWDLLPFGHDDFLATLYLLDALDGLAELEAAIGQRPAWNIPPAAERETAEQLRQLAAKVRSHSRQYFWNHATDRFVACVDADGVSHDFGYTFLNLEAVHYGLADRSQAVSILDWVAGDRSVDGDTSTGEDIYQWRFAPRATTRRNVEWYMWAWHAPESIPWGGQVQDGGAVLGFSFHDLMARIKTRGPDDAWARFQQILSWFRDVQSAGGYRTYYATPERGSLQGGGTPGGLGIDHEFLESVLVPQVMLYGFAGFRPTPTGIELTPALPADWPELTVTRIHYHDHVFDLRLTADEIEVTFRRRGPHELVIRQPGLERRRVVDRDP